MTLRPVECRRGLTFFLNCLWMASQASLIVTPLRFRAVTSSPSGKCRSIFLMGGVQRSFFRASLSSIVDGEVLSFLDPSCQRRVECGVTGGKTGGNGGGEWDGNEAG